MKIYVMTAVTDSGNGHGEFLGVVVGKTLAEVKIRAKNKWRWYGDTDPWYSLKCKPLLAKKQRCLRDHP